MSIPSIRRCAVDGCFNIQDRELSFFRFPKDEKRSQAWRQALGFTGTHRFANLSVAQCYNRIRICSSHFDETSFTNPGHNRVRKYAVPSLDMKNQANAIIDEQPSILKVDISVQSKIELNGKSSQAGAHLSANTPKIKLLKEAKRSTSKNLCGAGKVPEITLKDVLKFCDEQYSKEGSNFLKNQHFLLSKSPKGTRYSEDFKQFALSVYFRGPKAYKKMAAACRLPSKRTLERFMKRWTIEPGFTDFIFRFIAYKVRLLNDEEKDCMLCLDEISLKSHLFYDISKDKIVGFQTVYDENVPKIARSALVVMARGIASNWKQPIAYFFYKSSAPSQEIKDILFESVRKLNLVGLKVLGVVSDQGSNFQKLVKRDLKLTEENPVFFVDYIKLVYFFDVPHLLKSTRNCFFSYVFKLANGETNKSYLEEMYKFDEQKQFRLAPRLHNDHLYPNSLQKTKVQLASQIFSHSVGVAMHTYIDFAVLPKEASETANFILKMNNFFDLLNSSSSEKAQAFMGTDKQVNYLKEMDNLFKTLKICNHEGKDVTKQSKFIFGWRLTIKSTFILWEILKNEGYKYLFTRHLNQDCIESLFGQLRNYCGNVRNPTPIRFYRAFKKIFTIRYFDQTEGANCMEDVNEVSLYLGGDDTPRNFSQKLVPSIPSTYAPLKVYTNDYSNLKSAEGNALLQMVGYLLKKCLLKHSCHICTRFANSNDLISEEILFRKLKAFDTKKSTFEGRTIPSTDILDYIIAMEDIFINKFRELSCTNSVGKQIKSEFLKINYCHPCSEFPTDYLVSLYTRVRIYFTLKCINQDIKYNKSCTVIPKLKILRNL